MYQEHSFSLETSGIPPEQWQPPAGAIINFALDNTSSQTASMLSRKKGKKKNSRSNAFQSSSTTFRVQPAAQIQVMDLPTPRTPSNTTPGLDFEDSFEMTIGDAEWGLQREDYDISGPSKYASSYIVRYSLASIFMLTRSIAAYLGVRLHRLHFSLRSISLPQPQHL
jgi:hypothetical protein